MLPRTSRGSKWWPRSRKIAAERLFGSRWSNPLSVGIGLMLLSTLSAYLLLGPRVIYAMARTGQFPSIAARLSGRASTPVVATFLQVAVTLVLLWTGTYRVDHRLCERRLVDLLDAGNELDLHPSPKAA